MSIIDGANLAEFEVGKIVLKVLRRKRNSDDLEPRISGTAEPIPFKLDTQGNETVEHL